MPVVSRNRRHHAEYSADKLLRSQNMAQVRYIVDNVGDAVAFYVSKIGFELEQQFGPAIAMLVHGDLTLWVSGPVASASRPMPDWTVPSGGGG